MKFFGEASNHPGESASLQPRFGTLQLLTFPKTKITFEREEISDQQLDSGKYDGAADDNWENCVRSQGAHFEGDWGITVLCTMFLVSYNFNKCLYCSYYMAGYLLDKPGTKQYFVRSSHKINPWVNGRCGNITEHCGWGILQVENRFD